MNWEAIGAIGEIVGALAVIATLIYLARQIAHGTAMSRATQNKAIIESYEDFNNIIISNREAADLLAKLEETQPDISPAENVQVRHIAYRLINIWGSIQLSHANGQLSDDEFEIYCDDTRVLLDTYPGLAPASIAILSRYQKFSSSRIFDVVRESIDSDPQ